LLALIVSVAVAASFPPATHKDWVDVLRALLTPLAGLVALVFAYLNYNLSSRRRLDEISNRQFDLLMEFVNFGDSVKKAISEKTERVLNDTSLEREVKSRRMQFIFRSEVKYRGYALAVSAKQIFGDEVARKIYSQLDDLDNLENLGNLLRSEEFLTLVQANMVSLK